MSSKTASTMDSRCLDTSLDLNLGTLGHMKEEDTPVSTNLVYIKYVLYIVFFKILFRTYI